jgi:UDP-N-acetylmuramoyl-L-alanyl-D-glutamate--2,6-diaminopimelate ligase
MTIPEQFPVTSHTKHVGPGSTFVAIQGQQQNGIAYITDALQQGAHHIVVGAAVNISDNVLRAIRAHRASLSFVENPRQYLAHLSAYTLGDPAKKLRIIAVTGTKGKTTTAFLIRHVLKTAGHNVALLTSVKNYINDHAFATKLTTRQPDYLHMFFDQCVQVGVDWVVIEVAAQAFTLHRVAGISFKAGVFTNFSPEHAEFYSSQATYFQAKEQIVNHLQGAPLICNHDDEHGAALCKRHENVVSFGYQRFRFTQVYNVSELPDVSFRVMAGAEEHVIRCPLLMGTYNVYNVLAAIACTHEIGATWSHITQAMTTFSGVSGRLESHPLPNGATAIVDYAHNPASYEAILSTLRKKTNHLIVVFGCGGDRDRGKRSVMGRIVHMYADYMFVTSDNPRSEDPLCIANDILTGIEQDRQNVSVEIDRAEAIRQAYERSAADSVIAILGKGPERYQVINDVVYPFSEVAILRELV